MRFFRNKRGKTGVVPASFRKNTSFKKVRGIKECFGCTKRTHT